MKKIIITGGNGFIGSNLINFLLRKKFFIINIDKNAYSKKSYLLRDIKNVNYKFYKLDINSKKNLEVNVTIHGKNTLAFLTNQVYMIDINDKIQLT